MSTIWFLLSVSVPFLFAGTIIGDFHAQPGFNKVTLKWTSENEINLKGFEIERSFENKASSFRKIDFVKASDEEKTKKEYVYEDKSVFKAADRTFYYRLKILDKDGSSSYSDIISVSPTISSARQTWGSIKAMFR
ncbi:MAG: hypothetical protein ACE5IY_16885 [bacterium]